MTTMWLIRERRSASATEPPATGSMASATNMGRDKASTRGNMTDLPAKVAS